MKETYSESDHQAIHDLLFGRKVTKVSEYTLVLDNGIKLQIEPNEGCGGCSNGHYWLEELNGFDNAITNVEFLTKDIDGEAACSYQIFVLADGFREKLLQVDGDDGNGYYGTGYEIIVSFPNTSET